MKEKMETSKQSTMDILRATGSVVRKDDSLGLCRAWDDILASILDKKVEEMTERDIAKRLMDRLCT